MAASSRPEDEQSYPDVNNLAYTNVLVSFAVKTFAETRHSETPMSAPRSQSRNPPFLSRRGIIPIQELPTQQAISSTAIVTKDRLRVRRQFAAIVTTACRPGLWRIRTSVPSCWSYYRFCVQALVTFTCSQRTSSPRTATWE